MIIQVAYDEDRISKVKLSLLDKLLNEKMVTGFLRSDGLVVVGRDSIRIRSNSSQGYASPERRVCLE